MAEIISTCYYQHFGKKRNVFVSGWVGKESLYSFAKLNVSMLNLSVLNFLKLSLKFPFAGLNELLFLAFYAFSTAIFIAK